jgi:hypothetical protein
MSARRLAVVLLFAAAGSAAAQSFVTMGRLFTTPSERAQLDQARNGGTAAAGAGAGGIGGAGATSTGGAIAPMAPGASSTPCVGAAAGPGDAGGATGCAGTAEARAATAGPETVRLTGLIRRSNGRTTAFVNDEPQDARVVNQGKAARVNVDGRSVVLKPGQSFDPATGAINEPDR